VLAGDSAGAGLVLSTMLTLKRDAVPLPGGAVLLCPWLDLSLTRPPNGPSPLINEDEARRCAAAYLAGHPADDPIVDPLHAELTGLPPMLIQAATGDARLEDAKRLADQAEAHGIDARLELFPVQAHAFQLFWSFLPEAADAIEAAGAFIRRLQRHDRARRSLEFRPA
jgi:epsilon-lactone hydrolase